MFNIPEKYKTKLAGLASILMGLGACGGELMKAIDGDPNTVTSYVILGTAMTAISNGIGNMYSRANKVTSEQAGAPGVQL